MLYLILRIEQISKKLTLIFLSLPFERWDKYRMRYPRTNRPVWALVSNLSWFGPKSGSLPGGKWLSGRSHRPR